MSQMTATARPLRTPRRGTAPVPLRVMPRRIAATGNGGFATACLVLLTAGLIGLLLLNTALAQGSLALGALQKESAVLSDTAANLRQDIVAASASGTLARSATELGMVRSNERAYIDLATGKVTGTAYPATPYQALTIVTAPTPPPVPSGAERNLLAKAATSVLTTAAPKAKAKAKAKPATKPATTPGANATPKTAGDAAPGPSTATLGASTQTPAAR